MDIHKPKPWRGVREFGKELGTIVLGVLIALGAEQAVEWLHRGAEVRETREALRDELGLNLRNIRYSQVEDRCTDGHIAVWSAWARGGPKPVFTNGVFPSMAFAAWDVAKAGPLAHMPLRERLAYTRFYNRLVVLERTRESELDAMADFTGYRAFDRLSEARGQQVIVYLEKARSALPYKQAAGVELIAEAQALGVKPAAAEAHMQSNLQALCREVGIEVPG